MAPPRADSQIATEPPSRWKTTSRIQFDSVAKGIVKLYPPEQFIRPPNVAHEILQLGMQLQQLGLLRKRRQPSFQCHAEHILADGPHVAVPGRLEE